jgi:hypothetical protein
MLRRVLGFRPLCVVGVVSYGLYLYHIPVYHVIGPAHVSLRGYPLFALRLAVVGVLAYLSFVLIEKPVRLGTLKLPRMRILVPASFAVVVGTVVVATIGATATPSTVLAAVSYRRQAATTPKGTSKVLVAGDALAFSLGAQTLDGYRDGAISGTTVSIFGCGISNAAVVIGSSVFPSGPPCGTLQDDIHNARDAFQPDVVVVMTGPNEVFDRVVGGRVQRVGSPALEHYFDRELDKLRSAFAKRRTPVLLLSAPCMSPPQVAGSDAFGDIRRDARRVDWWNDVLQRYADAHASAVEFIDYGTWLCRSDNSPNSPSLRADGVTLSRDGSMKTWKWLSALVAKGHRANP